MGIAWCRGTAGEGPAWPFLSSLRDTPGLDGGWYLVPVTTKNIFLRLCLPSPKDTKSHDCGSWQHPREESGQCSPCWLTHTHPRMRWILITQLHGALLKIIKREEMPGSMAMALWIFSSLHKQSWENIRGHNSKNVCEKRGHCDRWFQELKITTWLSESPRALPLSLGASSCLCLYCHSWIKFSELDQYDWLALILRVSCPSHSLSPLP